MTMHIEIAVIAALVLVLTLGFFVAYTYYTDVAINNAKRCRQHEDSFITAGPYPRVCRRASEEHTQDASTARR